MSAAAASARGSMAARRSGADAGDQVTVTDSHHPALRMAPAASSRRQCPRDSWTCCQSPWLSRGRKSPEASRIGPLCARHLAVATLARGTAITPDRAHGAQSWCRSARCSAMKPPAEWPNTTGEVMPSAWHSSATSSAICSRVQVASGGRLDRPCPRRSTKTSCAAAARGSRPAGGTPGRTRVRRAARPWSGTRPAARRRPAAATRPRPRTARRRKGSPASRTATFTSCARRAAILGYTMRAGAESSIPGIRRVALNGSASRCPDLGCSFRDRRS